MATHHPPIFARCCSTRFDGNSAPLRSSVKSTSSGCCRRLEAAKSCAACSRRWSSIATLVTSRRSRTKAPSRKPASPGRSSGKASAIRCRKGQTPPQIAHICTDRTLLVRRAGIHATQPGGRLWTRQAFLHRLVNGPVFGACGAQDVVHRAVALVTFVRQHLISGLRRERQRSLTGRVNVFGSAIDTS